MIGGSSNTSARHYMVVVRDATFDGDRVHHIKRCDSRTAKQLALQLSRTIGFQSWALFRIDPAGMVKIGHGVREGKVSDRIAG